MSIEVLAEAPLPESEAHLPPEVSAKLGVSIQVAGLIVRDVRRLYMDRMTRRFTDLKFKERLKRTNPFLMQVRGVVTVRQWAENQVNSALFASEEEAIGHVLETIAKACHPGGREPTIPDDFDLEVPSQGTITGYQIKMSWDCMPMSSRKNLSNTIRKLKEHYAPQGIDFVGVFAPCYGRAITKKPPGQDYISMRSRDFWSEVGSGDGGYDVKVGEVCRLLCSEFRAELARSAIPTLIDRLVTEGTKVFGDGEGNIDYGKLFRQVNP